MVTITNCFGDAIMESAVNPETCRYIAVKQREARQEQAAGNSAHDSSRCSHPKVVGRFIAASDADLVGSSEAVVDGDDGWWLNEMCAE